MQRLTDIAQRILGLIFLVFGLNGFFHFLPVPPMAEPAQRFIHALIETGYLLPLWKGVEVVAGALLVLDIFAPLSLILLAPIVVNIFFVHTKLDPSNAHISIALAVLAGLSAWRNRKAYTPLLSTRAPH